MERTTIYIEEDLKRYLLEMSSEMSKKKGKRAAMANIVREALREYLAKKGIVTSNKNEITKRMLSTKGALDESFERRIKEVKRDFRKWEVRSA